MNPVHASFTIPHAYEVLFGRDIFRQGGPLEALLKRSGPHRRTLFLLDEGLALARPGLKERLQQLGEDHAGLVLQPAGEACKTLEEGLVPLLKIMADAHLCRQSVVVAIGGGAFLDLVGLATSLVHRGVRLIRCPSTVLSQNDAGVGVKNGINAFGQKNFIGTFAPPLAVFNDLDLLDSLDPRETRSGYAEAVKVALLRDPHFLHWIETQADALRASQSEAIETLVKRCAELHVQHICHGGDPFEGGSARPLDFGHWSAHRIENWSGHRIRHGEAVAMGMALDLDYGVLMGDVPAALAQRVKALLLNLGFEVRLPKALAPQELLEGLEEFREHLGGQLSITAVPEPGKPFERHSIDDEVMAKAITAALQ